MTLYFPRITTAQSEEARLIPLSGPPEPEISQIFPAHNFVIYGRAGATITDETEDEEGNPPRPKSPPLEGCTERRWNSSARDLPTHTVCT